MAALHVHSNSAHLSRKGLQDYLDSLKKATKEAEDEIAYRAADENNQIVGLRKQLDESKSNYKRVASLNKALRKELDVASKKIAKLEKDHKLTKTAYGASIGKPVATVPVKALTKVVVSKK